MQLGSVFDGKRSGSLIIQTRHAATSPAECDLSRRRVVFAPLSPKRSLVMASKRALDLKETELDYDSSPFTSLQTTPLLRLMLSDHQR